MRIGGTRSGRGSQLVLATGVWLAALAAAGNAQFFGSTRSFDSSVPAAAPASRAVGTARPGPQPPSSERQRGAEGTAAAIAAGQPGGGAGARGSERAERAGWTRRARGQRAVRQ